MYSEDEGVFSAEDMNQLMSAVYCGILPIICVIGTFGNALTFSVFYREKKKTSTTHLLLGLALADELCMIGQGFFTFIQIRNLYFKKQLKSLNIDSFFMSRLVFSFESASKTLTVAIVIERCLAVFRPFLVHRLCSKRVGFIVTVSVYLATLSSCSVELFQIDVIGDDSSFSTYELAIVTTSDDNTFIDWYSVVLHLVYGILTVLLIMGLNVAIITGVKKVLSNTTKLTLTKNRRRWQKQRKITRMLLTMSITYVVCCLPNDVCYVILVCDKNKIIAYEGNFYFQSILLLTYCLMVFNNAVNFIVYALTVKTMRRKYINTLVCCCGRYRRSNFHSSRLFTIVTSRV